MFGHATIPFFILFIALANLYLGYATAVFLGWGPAAFQPAKAAPVVSPLTASPAAAQKPAVVSVAAKSTSAAPSLPCPEVKANGDEAPSAEELEPELLAAIQSAIDQEP